MNRKDLMKKIDKIWHTHVQNAFKYFPNRGKQRSLSSKLASLFIREMKKNS